MTKRPILLWLRQDLRLTDNRALAAAIEAGGPVIPVFVLDDPAAGEWAIGAASRWWLHGSLSALRQEFEKRGAQLLLRSGATADVLGEIAAETAAAAVYCTRAYEPWASRLETNVRAVLATRGVELKRFGGNLLAEPDDIRTKAGEPFKVYTPFWRELSGKLKLAPPIAAPARIPFPGRVPAGDELASWNLLPLKPDWTGGMRESWEPGEQGALKRFNAFIAGFRGYAEKRNRPDVPATSRLSPHLHWGEISPATLWRRASTAVAAGAASDNDLEVFLKEIVWREFAYHLLVHWPGLPEKPFRPEFAAFPWVADKVGLAGWQRGRTGYPIVDAGMRELWHTGWMHNRVRMIVASFLIKDLRISWRDGGAWFWDTLVDADLANNSASWQWVAGSGADAAPYFRIFNPVTQGQKFDPYGAYVRRWVPEIAKLPEGFIHAPWEADAATLNAAGIRLGETYPRPIVDHAAARISALAAFERVKGARPSS